MNWSRKTALVILSGLLIALLSFIGCSENNSLGVAGSEYYKAVDGATGTYTPPDNQVVITDQVATTDAALRMLTFVASTETVIAADDCVIVEIIAGTEIPLEFTDIEVGDSVRVCGLPQEDGTILAHRIRVFGINDCPDYDLAIRDTIATIDYAAGTFTVINRTETIRIDENTIIWGVMGGQEQNIAFKTAASGPDDANRYKNSQYYKVVYEFTDLQVGDIVEIRAFIDNSESLLAASIKLANNYNYNNQRCITFQATIETVDITTRMVTFEGLSWVGTVCPGAALLDSAGESLTLADFAVGDFVEVKGIPGEGDDLLVCEMQLTGN